MKKIGLCLSVAFLLLFLVGDAEGENFASVPLFITGESEGSLSIDSPSGSNVETVAIASNEQDQQGVFKELGRWSTGSLDVNSKFIDVSVDEVPLAPTEEVIVIVGTVVSTSKSVTVMEAEFPASSTTIILILLYVPSANAAELDKVKVVSELALIVVGEIVKLSPPLLYVAEMVPASSD